MHNSSLQGLNNRQHWTVILERETKEVSTSSAPTRCLHRDGEPKHSLVPYWVEEMHGEDSGVFMHTHTEFNKIWSCHQVYFLP